MTKQEAYKTFRCWHCVYCDHDEGVCLCGDPDSEECPKEEYCRRKGFLFPGGDAMRMTHSAKGGEEMKYKVGDKFLQEIEIEGINEYDKYFCPYRMSTGSNWNENALDKLRRPDDMTAQEAWEIAGEIVCDEEEGGLSEEELIDIFGRQCFRDVLLEYTPQQAKAEIEAWKEKKEIGVGDIVKGSVDQSGIVTFIDGGEATVMWIDGSCSKKNRNDIKKTGRHIDIQGLFKQIGGENERNII